MKTEMVKRIHEMANRTWEAIGAECLVDEMGRSDESATWDRETVAGVVGDAEYMLTHGRDKEAYEAWKDLPWEERREILLNAFPFEVYGW